MSLLTVVPGTAETVAVSATSAQFAATLVAGKAYRFTSSTACYVAQGADPVTAVAGAGAGRFYVPANTPMDLHGSNGVKVAVVRVSADGFASIAPLQWH